MNKKLKKSGVCLLLSALTVGGAFAWLKTTMVAVKPNKIASGTFNIHFANQKDVITIKGDKAIPMTIDYAKTNLTPYVFSVLNEGDLDANYSIKVVVDKGDFNPENIKILLIDENKIETLANINSFHYQASLKSKELDKFYLYAYIDKNSVNNEVLDKSISFHLELEATQLPEK